MRPADVFAPTRGAIRNNSKYYFVGSFIFCSVSELQLNSFPVQINTTYTYEGHKRSKDGNA